MMKNQLTAIKKLILSLGFVSFLVCSLIARDTVKIKMPQLPIHIEKEDNILCYIRLEATHTSMLNEINLSFPEEVNTEEIENIKLYYSGTESVQRSGGIFYAPASYIARNLPGRTRTANSSYSIKKAELLNPGRQLTLRANQKLFPGVNYFWISIKMKPATSIFSTIQINVDTIKVDGKACVLFPDGESNPVRRMAIGVRHAGDDGADSYRIPGIVTSQQGTLLGVYDVRYNNSVDLQEYVNIGLSRSTDKGQTWEDMRIIMDFDEYGGLPKAQNGVGDPAILVDAINGTIWVIAAWTHGMGNGRAWFNSQPGMNPEHTAQLVLVKSEDDGKTWSPPINITSQVKNRDWHFLLQGPGNGITMEDGTLVFACQFIDAEKIPHAGIIYSRNKGETWHIHQPAYPNTTEAQVVEAEPGILMLNMRDNRGGSRTIYTTHDMGQTWNEHPSSRSALQEPVCMASFIKVAAKDNVLNKDILLFSNPDTTKERKNITIKASLDVGITWLPEHQILLDEGYGWGYSCLTQIDRETVGIFYESSTAHMTFQAIPLQAIINPAK